MVIIRARVPNSSLRPCLLAFTADLSINPQSVRTVVWLALRIEMPRDAVSGEAMTTHLPECERDPCAGGIRAQGGSKYR